MATEGTYYVPEQSKLPIFASLGLFLTVFGAANWINGNANGPMIFMAGGFVMAVVLWNWFSTVIDENMNGMNSVQLKRSYVWGMGWFIFSEVMFFAAFFGALWYIRNIALPELSEGPTNAHNWPGFTAEWPLMTTPDQAVNGDKAQHLGPAMNMSNPGIMGWFGWLPFWNTAVLITSSVTVHFAHTALLKNNKKGFNLWLGITIALAVGFLVLQYMEYESRTG